MSRRFLAVLCSAVLLSGCSFYKIDSRDTTLDFYPPKPSVEKVVYLEKIEKPHETIGIVTVTADCTRPFQEIVEKMLNEAAILGGDAITDIRSEPPNGKSRPASANIFVYYSAKVVVFK